MRNKLAQATTAMLFSSMLFSVALSAAENPDTLAATISTRGVGVEYSTHLEDNWRARLGFNSLNLRRDFTPRNTTYDTDIKLRTVSVIADYFPSDNGFTLSGGLIYNLTKIGLEAKLDSQTAGLPLDQTGAIRGTINFKRLNPYFSIGWRSTDLHGWSWSTEIGAFYQQKRIIDLTAARCLPQARVGSFCGQVNQHLAGEKAAIEKDLNDFEWYPVFSIGVAYQF